MPGTAPGLDSAVGRHGRASRQLTCHSDTAPSAGSSLRFGSKIGSGQGTDQRSRLRFLGLTRQGPVVPLPAARACRAVFSIADPESCFPGIFGDMFIDRCCNKLKRPPDLSRPNATCPTSQELPVPELKKNLFSSFIKGVARAWEDQPGRTPVDSPSHPHRALPPKTLS